MLCAMPLSYNDEAYTILALKEFGLAEDRFGMHQRYEKVLWEHNRGRNGFSL